MAMPTWPFTKLAFLTFLAFLELLEFLPSLEFLANDRSRSCSRFDVSSKRTNLHFEAIITYGLDVLSDFSNRIPN